MAPRRGLLGSLALVLAGTGVHAAQASQHPRAAQASHHPHAAHHAVVVQARCAQAAPRAVAPNPWAPAKATLAPAGATGILLCRYGGMNTRRPMALTASSIVAGSGAVGTLVREFGELPRFPPGAIACPMDDASQIVALLAYPSGRTVTIVAGMRGCAGVTNGDVSRTAFGFGSPRQFGPQLLGRLERLTGYHGVVF